ncbi:recombinase family protein [Mycolicibacterium murale]|uniref:recombinase family protein n=1 Tax=Mycolicibacterium murale TaxID=182220 RepID=UPI001875D847|nr:recombinase family protein [Mycolicibacterium murale]MCV7186398.1 recombinase family protein [Mycolicibacterium murale]
MRALGRLRLSVTTDESTSIERQREVIARWAEANGHNMIGWAEDVDVSGSIDPFDTPQLGDWLNNRAPEFDVIVAWKLDRLGRNAIQLSKLFGWCIEHEKTLVSCSESIDLSNWAGRMLGSVIAGLAEGELEAMRERQRASRHKLRETARWPGGRPPYGYRSVDNPAGAGKVLEIDPEAQSVVRRIVDSVIDGVPLNRIVRELNIDGIRPPADHYRVSMGREDTLSPWRTGPTKFLLTAPTLVGHAHTKGTTVRDADGLPVQMGEPLVTDDERELILAELARATGVPRERGKPAQLAGIAVCFFCGTRLTMTRQKKKYRYYRCPKACAALIPADTAEQLAEDTFLEDKGSEDVVERVWVPGDTNETELRAAVRAFDELSAAAGTMTSRTAAERLQGQLAALDRKIAELEAAPSVGARWEYRPTGEKYREVWERTIDPDERREMLKRAGIVIRLGFTGRTTEGAGAWHTATDYREGLRHAE